MEIIKHLQEQLISQLDSAIDRAQRQLNEELNKRETTVRLLSNKVDRLCAAEEKYKSRIRDLELRLAEISQNHADESAEHDTQQTLDKTRAELQQKYDPDRLIAAVDEERKNGRDDGLSPALNKLQSSYRALYSEVETLLTVTASLRMQVKRNKAKAEQWRRWYTQDLETLKDANRPISRRVRIREQPAEQRRSPSPVPPQHDVLHTNGAHVGQSNGSRVAECQLQSHPSHPRQTTPEIKQELDDDGTETVTQSSPQQELLSTQSGSSDDWEDPAPVVLPNIPPRNVPASSSKDDETEIVIIKSEPVPSSPPNIPRESDYSETQDLDEVGVSISTPRKQAFVVLEDTGSESSENQVPEKIHGLRSKDANTATASPSSRTESSKRRKTERKSAVAIRIVTEDGENFSDRKRRKAPPGTPRSSRNPEAHRRLDELLEAPSPQHQVLQRPTSVTPTAKRRPEEQRAPSAPAASSNGEQEHDKDKGRASTEEPRYDLTKVPYRQRPIDLLDLSCFKINPERNQGLDYAFTDVVRTRDQRRCVPGCMRSDCCGDKLRAMVRAGGVHFSEDDDKILEDYLGDQAHTLNTMSDKQRGELLIEAKARLLADRVGRRRHACNRPHSPPGFWRTDMPTTQEVEEDHRQADQLERDKVLERYMEAMRPGGLWKFADE
ncbi:hypothetical protein VTN31DRAFT_2335 [Thermomyces dupontii]|uniref:uncharacterized protein n=1 Tax=Talaromyces thermophilus TaxID=28565 RepID=UPI0037421023